MKFGIFEKLLVFFTFIFLSFLPVNADVMPCFVGSINPSSIGVYQATNNFNVYTEPSLNSKILFNVKWRATEFICEKCSSNAIFVVFLPKKDLAFLSVIDENDDETWVQISYNQNGSLKNGWVKKDEDFRFMNWRTFFNMYGRKYGLYFMKDAPDSSKLLYGSSDDDAKSIGKITLPQNIKLQNVSGNWLLAIAYDIDKSQKIGWLKWRNLSGEIFLFPDIK